MVMAEVQLVYMECIKFSSFVSVIIHIYGIKFFKLKVHAYFSVGMVMDMIRWVPCRIRK